MKFNRMSYLKLEGCLTVHLPREIMWNAILMEQGNFIGVFLARRVLGTYAHHQEHWMLSCSIRFYAPSFWMGGGLESRWPWEPVALRAGSFDSRWPWEPVPLRAGGLESRCPWEPVVLRVAELRIYTTTWIPHLHVRFEHPFAGRIL